jgi:putative spermidine/putrescine transport system substrate-binding protein
MNRRDLLGIAALLTSMPLAGGAFAFDGPELYPGEQALYDAAKKEGMVVSFDTGPTWANWAAEFKAFQKRYPGVEMVYNDIGSAATVVTLDKSRTRPQADTAYYFAASALDAVKAGVVSDFKPVNFDKLTEPLRDPTGQWFTVHTLNVAFSLTPTIWCRAWF